MKRSVVEWQSSVLDRDDDLTGSAEDVDVIPSFLFRLVRTIDDVAANRLDGPAEMLSIRVSQSELASSIPHKADHGGQERSIGKDRDASDRFLELGRLAIIRYRQCLFTDPESASKGLEVAHLSRLALELVTKLRVGDTYELAGPLSNAATTKLSHTVLGDDAVHHVLEGRNRRARV